MKIAFNTVLLFTLTMSGSLFASTLDENEQLIPSLYKQIGINNKVPYKLLYAVALAETGYVSPTNSQYRPWPWTLNVNGNPERHQTRSDAARSLQDHLDSGLKNIDIGIAQINFKYNGQLLPSINEALDPEVNLTVATEILARELKRCDKPNWWCAVGRYHSPGKSKIQKERAVNYTNRVRALWEQLL